MKKLILFDLDGTVLDTEADMLFCANRLFAQNGYPTIDSETVRRANGKDAHGYMRTLAGDAVSDTEIARLWQDYLKLIATNGADHTTVFDGVAEVLLALQQKGYILAALTNKAENEMPVFKAGILRTLPFDRVMAVGGTADAKPSPAAVQKCLQHYGVTKENTFLVGDGELDILTALAADIHPVAVLWGSRTRAQLAAVGATVFATHPNELLDILA